MLATSTTMAINVTLYKNLPYDPANDLRRSRCSSDLRSF